jgi:glyoxylase-like metal-dependent hydrolase (beta-lactamase superfamily II)
MNNRIFKFLDTPGHASHHFCILDHDSHSFFTGDTLGVAYQQLRDETHAFVMPTTTPVQFNPQALHNSIDKVMAFAPDWLYYTHYSALQPSARIIAGLHEQIDDFVRLTEKAAQATTEEGFEEKLARDLTDYLLRRASNELPSLSEETIYQWVNLDATLDAQGLAFWWLHRRAA